LVTATAKPVSEFLVLSALFSMYDICFERHISAQTRHLLVSHSFNKVFVSTPNIRECWHGIGKDQSGREAASAAAQDLPPPPALPGSTPTEGYLPPPPAR